MTGKLTPKSLLLLCAGGLLFVLVVLGRNNGKRNQSKTLRGGESENWTRRLQKAKPFLLTSQHSATFTMQPPDEVKEDGESSVIPLGTIKESSTPEPPQGPFLMLNLEEPSKGSVQESKEQQTPDQKPAILLSLLEPVTMELTVPDEGVVENSVEPPPKGSAPFLLSLLEPKEAQTAATLTPPLFITQLVVSVESKTRASEAP